MHMCMISRSIGYMEMFIVICLVVSPSAYALEADNISEDVGNLLDTGLKD